MRDLRLRGGIADRVATATRLHLQCGVRQGHVAEGDVGRGVVGLGRALVLGHRHRDDGDHNAHDDDPTPAEDGQRGGKAVILVYPLGSGHASSAILASGLRVEGWRFSIRFLSFGAQCGFSATGGGTGTCPAIDGSRRLG